MSSVAVDSVDIKSLRRLYQSDTKARAVFDHVAERKKNSSESTVDRLLGMLGREGQDVSRRDLIAVLQSLASYGAGEFVVGRRGQPSRFRWSVGMVGLGKSVRGDPGGNIESIDETEVVAEQNDEDSGETGKRSPMIEHSYQLRPGTRIVITLPADLQTREALRLADFIKTLPFDEPTDQ